MNKKKIIYIVIAVLLIFTAGLVLWGRSRKRASLTTPVYYVYLPIIENYVPPYLGVNIDPIIPYSSIQYLIPDRVYETNLRWEDIEDKRGVFTFNDDVVEPFVKYMLVLDVKGTPTWARAWDKQGAPPKPEFYFDYANIVQQIVKRYKPWAVEIYNEPDVPDTLDDASQYYFGAWVQNGDYYGAGARYARLTCVTYPAVKYVDPDTQVLAGALIGADTSFEFLKGMVDTGICADYISFHKYIYTKDEFDAIFAFADKIKQYSNLPLIVTETSVLSDTPSPEHEKLKSEYIAHLKNAVFSSDISIVEMYSWCNNWMNSALLPDCTPGIAYDVWSKN